MIAYTLGEPAGIGADIIIQLAQSGRLEDIVCVGDARLLAARAKVMALPLRLVEYPARAPGVSCLSVYHQPVENHSVCGVASTNNVPGVMAMLNTAIDGCLSGEFSALTTGPLHKGVINDSGVAFSGHTEYLAGRIFSNDESCTEAPQPVMMLATSRLRVALITTHLPLKDVSAAITRPRIERVCRIIHRELQDKYQITQPRILVCGLNPHAGEGGHLGMEEIDTIIPALNALRQQGLDVVGPLPADTLFTEQYLATADVAVAMYHDQGLPVLKALGFGKAANITLGLPIIRTSVDHGTAFDLAGSGRADTGSLETALAVARQMSRPSRNS
ncbi:MAG: 4-hydroxythreonine-4-phosphate dehydrogenase PdxA [Gammaproteobacteria bacterium]|nr:4-hydroxythreonine-4-phosphate dehydrogenase PdxA [Gammaproteobacteria bacterium]